MTRASVRAVYDSIGHDYSRRRRPDPRIAAQVTAALGAARTVLNVGAGSGSYEPNDRYVIAVEPSAVMLSQRIPASAPAVMARAEALPFSDDSFDAVMAVLTLHHWSDKSSGLAECARVARRRLVLLTWDPSSAGFWLVNDYLPEFLEMDIRQFPSIEAIRAELTKAFGTGVHIDSIPVHVPNDCIDGFLGAYWARPGAYLDPSVRAGISSFARADLSDVIASALDRLRADLSSGEWERRYGGLRKSDTLDVGYRLVVAHPR